MNSGNEFFAATLSFKVEILRMRSVFQAQREILQYLTQFILQRESVSLFVMDRSKKIGFFQFI